MAAVVGCPSRSRPATATAASRAARDNSDPVRHVGIARSTASEHLTALARAGLLVERVQTTSLRAARADAALAEALRLTASGAGALAAWSGGAASAGQLSQVGHGQPGE